jgi:hypothetical protein
MGAKLVDPYEAKRQKLNPGPGTYEFSLKAMKTSPQFGFGSSTRQERRKAAVQDPGAYEPKNEFVKTASPAFRMGSETRKMFDDKRTIPGPGNYATANSQRGPKYSMGLKLKELEAKVKVPGAGAYNPTKDSVQ